MPPGSSAALTAAITLLLHDPALRERMGEDARRRAVERFDERRVMADLVDAYRALGAGQASAGVALRARPPSRSLGNGGTALTKRAMDIVVFATMLVFCSRSSH